MGNGMESIPLLHAQQAVPFVDFLNRLGAPTARMLQRCHLPQLVYDGADVHLPERQIWALAELATQAEGIPDLGLRVGQLIDLRKLGLAQQLSASPTLYDALSTFCEEVRQHSSHAAFWLVRDGDDTMFCRRGIAFDVGQAQVELYTLMLMIQLVRLSAGSQWQPTTIWLQQHANEVPSDAPALSEAAVHSDAPLTAFTIPNALLSAPLRAPSSAPTATAEQPLGRSKEEETEAGFSPSLRRVLAAYLGELTPDIKIAAEIAGMSVRSLQRRLAADGLSFSRILDQARFECAKPLLRQSDMKLTDIAFELGYSDQAHFTRAFRRWAGISPREFRRQTEPA